MMKKNLFVWFMGLVVLAVAGYAQSPGAVHEPFDKLLKKYVEKGLIRYDDLAQSPQDLSALAQYLNTLQRQKPSRMERKQALAFWINLYNAATLKLVLDHYPVKSIKDIGGFFSSPWNKKVVTIEGKELTLNQIENEIIRPEFADARIHFALNCASLGCPPMQPFAYTGDKLDEQLDTATRASLAMPRWLRISDEAIFVTRLFDWYKDDFISYAGSVRAFLARYAPEADRPLILDEKRPIRAMDYDWKLNKAK